MMKTLEKPANRLLGPPSFLPASIPTAPQSFLPQASYFLPGKRKNGSYPGEAPLVLVWTKNNNSSNRRVVKMGFWHVLTNNHGEKSVSFYSICIFRIFINIDGGTLFKMFASSLQMGKLPHEKRQMKKAGNKNPERTMLDIPLLSAQSHLEIKVQSPAPQEIAQICPDNRYQNLELPKYLAVPFQRQKHQNTSTRICLPTA